MELKLLEDFLALIEDRNFSKAARRRYLSQPAFSRRIQALEKWLGTTVVDRSTQPITFKPSPERLEADLRALVYQLYELRSRIRIESQARKSVAVGGPEALIISVFPKIVRLTRQDTGNVAFRVHCGNRDECISMLLRRQIDLLLCYETPRHPVSVPAQFARRVQLGADALIPVASRPWTTSLRKRKGARQPIPVLIFPAENFLGRVLKEEILGRLMQKSSIAVVCESTFSGGLKAMALQGMGVAWLPRMLVAAELEDGSLSSLAASLGSVPLQISLLSASDADSGPSHEVFADLEKRAGQSPDPIEFAGPGFRRGSDTRA